MKVLLSPELLKYIFDSTDTKYRIKILNILHNKRNNFCLSKNYLNHLENYIKNTDGFQGLIKELYDNKRIEITNIKGESSIINETIKISQTIKEPLAFTLTIEGHDNHYSSIDNLIVLFDYPVLSKEWMTLELMSYCICNLSYLNFKNDKEIKSFFDNLFSIPNYIREAYIFNRQIHTGFLGALKNKSVKYYTTLKGGKRNAYELIPTKKLLNKELGGKAKVFVTENFRTLHERKIIFEDIIITLDNSFENLTVNEPTWEILIVYDKEKALEWKKKCSCFHEI